MPPTSSTDLLDAPTPANARTGGLDLAASSREVLNACVAAITGNPNTPPRTGQARLLDDISEAFDTPAVDGQPGGVVVGEAPTGTGKSFAYLVPAAVAAAHRGERTVISTEMISLQNQIIVKDAPVVADACEQVTGYRPRTAILKGWGNFACAQAALSAAAEIVPVPAGLDGVDGAKYVLDHLPAIAPAALDLPVWALRESLSLTAPASEGGVAENVLVGDKDAYPDTFNERAWGEVSVSSGDCLGNQCPFREQCAPARARRLAAEADIVVTNHHLLAVQAAKHVPVVTGSEKMGPFHHIVVDEAHGLPPIVRDQGAAEITGRSIRSAARALTSVFTDRDPQVAMLIDDAEKIAVLLESELAAWTENLRQGQVCTLGETDDPIESTAPRIRTWVEDVRRMLRRASGFDPGLKIKAQRARGRIDTLVDALDQVSEHRLGTARWVEIVTPHNRAGQAPQQPYPVAKSTPVEVAGIIRDGLWTLPDPDAIVEESDTESGEGFATPKMWLTVVTLSATLPRGYARQVGLKATTREYESPFDTAYGRSVLFVPRAVEREDVDALGNSWGGGRAKFDVAKHQAWATGHILDLVAANEGSALILAATARAGQAYAEALRMRALGRWAVHSQWDGAPLRRLVAEWKADVGSVLIGTKSLMTGVDASGETCTLVIIDRPARAAGNPVDDARVAAIMEAMAIDRWAADRLVYVADAAAMLAQSAGRLIRSINDSGMVAVLDPRLLKSGPYAYPKPTREEYGTALHRFTERLTSPEQAAAWLKAHRNSLRAAG